ncbi:PREDICTED: uncharacterized protein LOC108565054 [Nicrophorus vespilloides]|uniref:Uncharacterized protein LOC108565054 n=1 Tax=Nicrophorus vespilloides TaxID=110193 RepID=A0ABM1MYZ8_NICVS|nr:PREDICTED: uncharacterized protein LOC108565054 [Nicrophorus vespilloides]
MSGPRSNMSQMNGNNRRPPNIHRVPSMEKPPAVQHDELIKYICDSWTKVCQDLDKNTTKYYNEQENIKLKDFRPFDLEAFWGRRTHKNYHQPQHS